MAEAARLKIAVFIDFDNIEIGVKTTLGRPFDVGTVLEAIKERGEVVTKFAYGDWQRAGDHSRQLTQHAIHMVQRNLTPGGDKNGADINLALDALEMAFTHNHINAFVVVSGDSDFIALVEKLKQYDKKVFVVGGRAFTSIILQKNCNEFIAYENLIGSQASSRRPVDRGRQASSSGAPEGNLAQVFPLVKRALQVLSEREVSPQLGLLKSTLLQLDSTFSEREYGAGTFRDFVQRLAKAGLVNLKGTDRSVHVELRDPDAGAAVVPVREWRDAEVASVIPHPAAARQAGVTPSEDAERDEAPEPVAREEDASAPQTASSLQPADAMEAIRRIFRTAATAPRWPMYVRNVKQFLRATDETFDEKRYGFQGILDVLRLGQRENIFRLERDRRGILRVFPGPHLQAPTASVGAIDVTAASESGLPETAGGTIEPRDGQIQMLGTAAGARGLSFDAIVTKSRDRAVETEPAIGAPPHGDPLAAVVAPESESVAPAERSGAARSRRKRTTAAPVARKKTAAPAGARKTTSRTRKPKAPVA